MKRHEIKNWIRPLTLKEFPKYICYEAGHLVTDSSSWRSNRPVIIKPECKSCLRCYLLCPEGSVYIKDGKAEIDYGFCKGCGICSEVCPFGAVSMCKEGDESK